MSQFYVKKNDNYIPIEFSKIVSKDWDNNLVTIRIGTDEYPADKSEIDSVCDALNDVEVLDDLKISFFITVHNLNFEVVGNLKEISEKYIAVRINSNDNISKLGEMEKDIKKQLRSKTKKVVILPSTISVKEYEEILEIKNRVDNRKKRRGY